MSYVKALQSLTIASVLLLAAACAKVPTTEITAAEKAMAAARDAEADTYAVEEWSKAQEAMTAAKAEIAAQEPKMAMLRSYSKAIQMLAEAETLALTAERAGTAGREQARQEAETAIAQVKTDLETASNLLVALGECPSKPKGFTQDLQLLEGNLQGLSDSLPEIEAKQSDGQFGEARTLASSLQAEVSTFVVDLDTAKTKIKC